ncbi:hypothetical protein [Endozoicomonas arenosclerae]|uniref:hypothetical protein n=1 Tax=Endozoicomonas arenosclerae TaxID=1633495 RepID=UPI001560B3D4|nr:hypothetical protein [Endozoicomonas arenosclerae]
MFDKNIGKGGDLRYIEDLKTSGFCSQGEFGWIAIFPENGNLICQINSIKWHLLDDDVDVEYFHDYHKKTTKFSIKNNKNNFDINYKSWWANRDDFDINPMAASSEEENSEEDIFGYIKMLKDNQDSASNLNRLWSNNLLGESGR